MSQIQTIYLLKEVTGREGRKTCRKTMCNEKGEKFWGAEKMGLVNSQQEELQRLGSTGTGPRRIRNISPQQRQERKFQIKIPSTDLHTHNTHKNFERESPAD